MSLPQVPGIEDLPEIHADWLEWSCLTRGSGYISWADHVRDLGIQGIELDEAPAEQFEILLDDVRQELAERETHCGPSGYPFRLEQEGLSHLRERQVSTYEFLLALTLVGHSARPRPNAATKLFEELGREALHAYLGGRGAQVQSRVFGFPRRVGPEEFRPAVDALCRALGEGVRCTAEPEAADQKDAHLDLVAWVRFSDDRQGKVILFGNCATGENWFDKIHELQPAVWCDLWMEKSPPVKPIASLLVPRRIESDRWRRAAHYGGIIFDRCRLTALVPSMDDEVGTEIAAWTLEVLGQGRP
ncbi:MAG TPA: hypothetical protein VGS22_26200 [Thermoanaerobaculia bacterium]|jgi:hypothetical protein|nr:hypothetical protein [Thermoanaerobaculia bacterium]